VPKEGEQLMHGLNLAAWNMARQSEKLSNAIYNMDHAGSGSRGYDPVIV